MNYYPAIRLPEEIINFQMRLFSAKIIYGNTM